MATTLSLLTSFEPYYKFDKKKGDILNQNVSFLIIRNQYIDIQLLYM
jgi:hypothetical protein